MTRFYIDTIFGLFLTCGLMNFCLTANSYSSPVVFHDTYCNPMTVPDAMSARKAYSCSPQLHQNYLSGQRSCSPGSSAYKALFCCDSEDCTASSSNLDALYRCGGVNANIWHKNKGGYQCGGSTELTHP